MTDNGEVCVVCDVCEQLYLWCLSGEMFYFKSIFLCKYHFCTFTHLPADLTCVGSEGWECVPSSCYPSLLQPCWPWSSKRWFGEWPAQSTCVCVCVNSSGCLKLVSRICDLLKYIYLWSFGMGKGGSQEWRGGFRYLSQQGAGSPFTWSRYIDKE